MQSLEDTSLDRLQAVVDVRYRPFPDDIGGVIEKIIVKELMELALTFFCCSS
ncbi:hypothetical protein VU11_06295 [Desulfobulbus sp. US2]|nr:hypothetical protein [Desulfobulbus sp. US2]